MNVLMVMLNWLVVAFIVKEELKYALMDTGVQCAMIPGHMKMPK